MVPDGDSKTEQSNWSKPYICRELVITRCLYHARCLLLISFIGGAWSNVEKFVGWLEIMSLIPTSVWSLAFLICIIVQLYASFSNYGSSHPLSSILNLISERLQMKPIESAKFHQVFCKAYKFCMILMHNHKSAQVF